MIIMNKGGWYTLYLKFFKSGNPVFLYVGLNVVLFFVPALLSMIFTLSGRPGMVSDFIHSYLAFPAALEQFPLKLYTLFTYSFFHADFFHLLFNLLWLYWIGQIFLDFQKPRVFHQIYIGGGLIGALSFLALFHWIPLFSGQQAVLIGASACVMAILAATATLLPDYSMRLMLFGELKLKYLLLIYLLLDLVGMGGANAGGNIAHLGGAFFGFIYIRILQRRVPWPRFFERKPKLKVVRPEKPAAAKSRTVSQKEIDVILDKISKTGYQKLSKEEKETLFKASKE